MNGKGRVDFRNKEYYEGSIISNHFHGFGKYYFRDSIYEGDFTKSLPNGFGILKKNNKVIKGFWREGKLTTEESIILEPQFIVDYF